MRPREEVRSGAEDGNSQSGEISWSVMPSEPPSKVQRWSEASPFFRKLNRQIPELETPLTLRKQTTAKCSNRQKIQFCSTQGSPRKLHASLPIPSTGGRTSHIS